MGDWNINIQGTGCHHNQNEKIDADLASVEFVKTLKAQGHTIHDATFITGGKTDLVEAAGIEKKNAETIWHIMEGMQGQIGAEIRVMLGESPLAQSMFDAAQRARRVEAMKKCAAESTSDADRHESWMKMHIEAGWVFGDEFDPVKKTHPNLKPWDQLPPTTRSKVMIFDIVAKTAVLLNSLS
jgi:hypothetical protein